MGPPILNLKTLGRSLWGAIDKYCQFHWRNVKVDPLSPFRNESDLFYDWKKELLTYMILIFFFLYPICKLNPYWNFASSNQVPHLQSKPHQEFVYLLQKHSHYLTPPCRSSFSAYHLRLSLGVYKDSPARLINLKSFLSPTSHFLGTRTKKLH